MIDYLLAVAVVIAIVSAATRDRTALILLLSFVVSKTMCEMEVPFNVLVWMLIDLVAIVFIVRPGIGVRDWLIVAAFLPAWLLYISMPVDWAWFVNLIVVGQMLLVFPTQIVKPALHWLAEFNRKFNPWDDIDLKAIA